MFEHLLCPASMQNVLAGSTSSNVSKRHSHLLMYLHRHTVVQQPRGATPASTPAGTDPSGDWHTAVAISHLFTTAPFCLQLVRVKHAC
jgi:hypothetical protein